MPDRRFLISKSILSSTDRENYGQSHELSAQEGKSEKETDELELDTGCFHLPGLGTRYYEQTADYLAESNERKKGSSIIRPAFESNIQTANAAQRSTPRARSVYSQRDKLIKYLLLVVSASNIFDVVQAQDNDCEHINGWIPSISGIGEQCCDHSRIECEAGRITRM
jgi:hypothetical protein